MSDKVQGATIRWSSALPRVAEGREPWKRWLGAKKLKRARRWGMKRVLMSPEEPSLFSAAQRRWAVAGTGKTEALRHGERETERLGEGETVKPGEAAAEGLELFQGAAAVDGYARWKAEAAQARAAEAEARRAAELPAQGDGAGYAAWKSEAEAAKRAFEQRWGVPLGKPVRVQLRGEAREREGCLFVAGEAAERGKPLRLRLGSEVFEASRIESVVRVQGD
jgi:hypothetical protein